MYLAYYGLKREPFHTTPDPSFLFLSPSHKEALGAIIYGIEKRKGFIAIIGEVGVGKTSILRAYLEQKVSQKQKTIYLFNPVLSFHDLLIAIFRGLEIEPKYEGVPDLVNQLHEVLVAEYQAGGTVVLAIDEAQNMPVETLENLRMLSNLETSTDKLIQIILLGQPELSALLSQPALRQFQQRIALWATICALTEEESRVFIEHRIARACTIGTPLLFAKNETAPVLFTKSALTLIARQAEGIPRRINVLCDNALITGFGRQCKPVPVSVVREIIGDVNSREVAEPKPNFRWAVAIGVAILFLILSIIFFFDSSSRKRQVEMQSMSNQADKHTSDINTKLKSGSSSGIGQSIQTPSANVQSMPSSMLNNARNDRSPESYQEQSIAVAGVQAAVANLTLDESEPSLPKRGVSVENQASSILNRTDNGVVQDGRSAMYAEKSIDRKSKSFENAHAALTYSTRGGRAVTVKRNSVLTENNNTRVRRTIKEGESLSQIAIEAYGSPRLEYLEWVKENNPQIVNPDFILPGQNIVLPKYKKVGYRNE